MTSFVRLNDGGAKNDKLRPEAKFENTRISSQNCYGALFVIFGCNGFLGFLPAPRIEGLAGQFFEELDRSHYFFVMSAFQIVRDLFLILNRFIGVGLAVLAPIIVNILCFHIFMLPSGLPLPIFVAVIWLFWAFQHRRCLGGVFVIRYYMPEMNGAMAAVRMKDSKPEVPVALLSSDERLPLRELEAVDCFMPKSEPIVSLLEKVDYLLSLHFLVRPFEAPDPRHAYEHEIYSKDCTRICGNHLSFPPGPNQNLPQGTKKSLGYPPLATRLVGYKSMEVSVLGDQEALGRRIALVRAEGAVCWQATGFALIRAMVHP